MVGDAILWVKKKVTIVKNNWKKFLKQNIFCIHDYEVKPRQSLWQSHEVHTCTKCGRVKVD